MCRAAIIQLILAGWISTMSIVIAQERIYNYVHFKVQDGLPSNIIRDAALDKQGLVWITTNKGLSYYDGHSFFNVNFDEAEGNSVSNDLGQISLGENNKIWITTYNQGLLCYDRTKSSKEAITTYAAKVDNGILEKQELYAVHSSVGKVYFGGQETDLQVLDIATSHIRLIKLGREKNRYTTIYSITEDQQGILWVGTRYNGLYSYDPVSGKIESYDLKNSGENGVGGVCFIEDRAYASYYDHDLISIHNRQQQIIQTKMLNIGYSNNPYDNTITDIAYFPEEKKILAAHNKKGIYSYDLASQHSELISWDKISPKDPLPVKINRIVKTPNGYLICSNNGLFYYSRHLNRIKDFIPTSEIAPIERIFKVGNTRWYITKTALGELSYDLQQRKTTYPLRNLSISQVSVVGDSIYLSTFDQGVYVFSTKTQQLNPLKIVGPSFSFEKADCNKVVADTVSGSRVLWIGSWSSGLYKYNISTQAISLYGEGNGLVNNKVITVAKDAKGALWLGLDGFGAARIEDKSTMKFTNFMYQKTKTGIASNTVFCFMLDKQGTFWYSSSQQGIGAIIDRSDGTHFRHIKDLNRFPWIYVHRLEEDLKGRIWMKAADGVMLFDPENGIFSQLHPGKGISPPAWLAVKDFYIDADALIWTTDMGLVKGPISAIEQKYEEQILPVISTFKIMNRDNSYRLLKGKLILSPQENTFTFHFANPMQMSDGNLKYRYKLEGIDADWIDADEYQQAVYSNVPGGDYVFSLRVSDQNGYWSDGSIHLPVHIQLRWFQSFWFKAAATGSFFLLIILFLIYRIQHQKKINRLQQKFTRTLQKELKQNARKIREQAEILEIEKQEKLESEFRQQLYESELKAIRSQMNPHFIFNILNSIEAYVVEQDATSASKLIHKFAALSRIVLENSQFSVVSIASELQLVKLYLDLEQERFSGSFSYSIKIEKTLKESNKKIPSMLIQPIVENAVHHGVRHLLGSLGKILVSVTERDQKIVIAVLDNGVGFNVSYKVGAEHFKTSSFGLKGVEERLRMINSRMAVPEASLEIDKNPLEEEYNAKVIITLPSIS
ncbi:sensor histidine kinase [Sphingobacterium faecale]|uniref:Histidine kinase n=1 Tax=Sphingobacterium faecale TaxID=2803775 RepID=A0ABS1R393_9SPHI|nr:sensor histidine kinase [Sphingobacterium faecale]MBL1409168.1 histidine kinase [Sphingobacterium faecale]